MSKYLLKELKIEVTHQCPLACLHCSSKANMENQNTMPFQKCMEILSEAVQLGVKEVAFSGGEPLIWNGLGDAIRYAHDHGVHTTIYTSGNVEPPQRIRDTFEMLEQSGLERAVFSLYSVKEAEHVRVTRKRDSYRNTLSSIDICCECGIVPEVHFVALSDNYHMLSEIVTLAEAHGVSRVSVLRLVPQGRGEIFSKTHTMSKGQNLALKREIERLRAEGHEIRTGSPFNVLWLNNPPECLAAQDRLIVAPDLRIYPCDAFKQVNADRIIAAPKYSMLEHCSLYDCWEKSDYLNVIRNAVASPPHAPCDSCNAFPQCGSGCLAQKFLYHGTLDTNPDPACLKGTA